MYDTRGLIHTDYDLLDMNDPSVGAVWCQDAMRHYSERCCVGKSATGKNTFFYCPNFK